jgi:hypothetical protein
MKTVLQPDQRARIIAKLERASDDPRLSPQLRARIDRTLSNLKKIQKRVGSTKPIK